MRATTKWAVIAMSLAVSVVAAGRAGAAIAYSQNFDTGAATFTTNDPYWSDSTATNGLILKTDGGNITQDASGPGFYLFEGTGNYQGGTTIAAGKDQFFISPTFGVVPNTAYTVSFKLTNEGTTNIASVRAELNGQLFGPSSATGTFNTNGWQNFSFSWNSGASTTASLILHDLTNTTSGNDFGVDEIAVVTPEPADLALLGIGMAGFTRRCRRTRVI